LDRLKELRRDWNRNLKYTPAGMAAAGVSTPQGAMDRFRTTTEDFRQANKPAYNRMYPISGMAMDYPEKGGLAGMFLKGLGKNIRDYGTSTSDAIRRKLGIGGADIGATQGNLENYAEKTFPSNVHPGTDYYDTSEFDTAPIEVTDLDSIDEDSTITPSSEIKVTDLDPDLPFHSKRAMFPRDETADEIIYDPGEFSVTGPVLDEPTGRTLEDVINEPLPFDDSAREAGIASLYSGIDPFDYELYKRELEEALAGRFG